VHGKKDQEKFGNKKGGYIFSLSLPNSCTGYY